ncbi:hypothetical protein AB835_09665 [Candidatus Endobugula sertula]|uniref:Uncharacterized protein n=1 Tax=Candidatus Endobugula sertula TaxID=62101 RepID=A0A1D2QNX1_9GAMM|nr:hypothetical protein AB835_09665 [Candidatus Endobugula sertula]
MKKWMVNTYIVVTQFRASKYPNKPFLSLLCLSLCLYSFSGFSHADNDDEWGFCSEEFRTCTLPVPGLVRYGENGKYIIKNVIKSIECRNHVFGNPINVRKHCDYQLSTIDDYDGDGIADRYDLYPNDPLNNKDTDGDNIPDSQDPFPEDPDNAKEANWIFCSEEFFECKVPVPALIRYGIEGQYFFKRATNTITCNNSTFGNPVNVRKHCDYLLSDTADFDSDGVVDSIDLYPANIAESQDTDGDGLGDNSDPFPADINNGQDRGSQWVHCANEWFECQISDYVLVRYGVDEQYNYRWMSESFTCNNATFGNPANAYKRCDYLISENGDDDRDNVSDQRDPLPFDASNNAAHNDWTHCAREWRTCKLPVPALVRFGVEGDYVYRWGR